VPVFADVAPDTLTIDVEDIKRKITPYTKAIIPVSIYGLSPDMDAIMALAKERNITVIEDDAQCFLGYYKGRLAGTIGHAASFSLQGSKHMTTSGEGGMVITNDESYATRIRKAGVLGYSSIGPKPGSVSIPRDIRQDWEYKRHDGFGYNYRMPSVCAALGLGQLERLDDLVLARQVSASLYDKVVRECKWLIPQLTPEGYIHSYFTYACRLDPGLIDIDFRIFRKKFIEMGGDGLYGAWYPVHLEPVFRNMCFYGNIERAPNFHPLYHGNVKSYQPGDCPVIEKIQPTILQFKTNFKFLEKAKEQADTLRKTIEYFN
jgi:perosamine synthetase